jgi:purine-nucleoside phosphorylase
MSTVPEVIAVRQMGVRTLAIGIITNRAAGLSRKPLNHMQVLQTSQAASRDLARLIDAVLPALAREGG